MTRVTMVQVKPISELLGLEHGDAQVDEHHDGDAEEDALGARSYPVQRPDETEHHQGEADDAEHCEEICHGIEYPPPPLTGSS